MNSVTAATSPTTLVKAGSASVLTGREKPVPTGSTKTRSLSVSQVSTLLINGPPTIRRGPAPSQLTQAAGMPEPPLQMKAMGRRVARAVAYEDPAQQE